MDRKGVLTVALRVIMVTCISAQHCSLSHLSSVYMPTSVTNTGAKFEYDEGELSGFAFDRDNKMLYTASRGRVEVYDASDMSALQNVHNMTLIDRSIVDILVCGQYVFMSVTISNDNTNGEILVFDRFSSQTGSMEKVYTVPAGSQPDKMAATSDCRTLVVTMEGGAYMDGNVLVDPLGAVAILSFPNGFSVNPDLKYLYFTDFDSKEAKLLAQGVRFVYRAGGNNFSNDLEPETVTLDEKHNRAFVTLQENNGYAIVDLSTKKITEVRGFGYKQWGKFDPSDKDGGPYIQKWPIRAFYQPDGTSHVNWKGRSYLITANEGDDKEYDNGFSEQKLGKEFSAAELSDQIPDMVKKALTFDTLLGRLKLSKIDGKNSGGKFEHLYTYGGRSFSIWDTETKELVWDSESELEKIIAIECPHLYNADLDGDVTYKDAVDKTSADKGPEPMSVTWGQIGARLFIFVGIEEPGIIFVYSVGDDVKKPRFEHVYCDGIPRMEKTFKSMYDDGDMHIRDPEQLEFIPEKFTGKDHPVLIVADESISAITILKVDITEETETGSSGVIGPSAVVVATCILLWPVLVNIWMTSP